MALGLLGDRDVGGSGGVVGGGGRTRKDLQPEYSPLSLYIMYCSEGRCQMQKHFFSSLRKVKNELLSNRGRVSCHVIR